MRNLKLKVSNALSMFVTYNLGNLTRSGGLFAAMVELHSSNINTRLNVLRLPTHRTRFERKYK